jgi:TetR/AcrR family transcriptional regulator, copper-responsive repressor
MGRPKLFTRADVLDKAIPVFWKHGLSETTVQDLEQATGVNKSGLYAEFQDKEDLFVESLRRYLELLHAGLPLSNKPLGWNNIENFLNLSYGTWGRWGQKGCFSVNSMREFSYLPPEARELIVGSAERIRRQLIRNVRASRGRKGDNEALADLIIAFFSGISVEQNLNPSKDQIANKITRFMQLIRAA